ncbi:MAG: c-type cytochrome [Nitrososphaerales archaeon]
MIVLFLFIPYISIVFGGVVFSVIYRRIGEKENSKFNNRLAREIVEITTINKSVGVILGIVPIITSILIYSQLLHNSTVTNLHYLALSLVFVTIALILIYSYRYSLSFNNIFDTFSGNKNNEPGVIEEINKLSEESSRISKKAGPAGLVFLFFGLWFFVTAITIPTLYPDLNNENFNIGIFSWEVLSRLIFYILFALTLTGGMILFISLQDEKRNRIKEQEYSDFVRHKIIKVTFFASSSIPVMLLLSVFGLPTSSLTGTVFFYAIVSLVLLFLGYHFLYLLTKEIKGTFAALLFLVLILSIASFIISDQTAMSTATRFQSASLSTQFDKYLAELRGEGKTVVINAAEMYQVKCASCHKWDEKLVGPAHFDVLPKYIGKEAQLIAFIRNPVKVNPDFPSMPNPGLKPNEADALAKYLLETYNEKFK